MLFTEMHLGNCSYFFSLPFHQLVPLILYQINQILILSNEAPLLEGKVPNLQVLAC